MAKKATGAKKSGRAKKSAGGQDLRDKIIDAALQLALEQGWRGLSLSEIAAAAKAPLSEVFPLFPSKGAILSAFVRRVDADVMAGQEADALEGSAKDRLFDVLMRRFDALQPHREALAAIAQDQSRDPLAVVCGLCRLRRSMAGTLEAANLSSDGCRGALRIKGLSAVYLATLRVWFRDDSADLAKTMAALDKQLCRAEALMGRLGGVRRSTEAA